jgi:predicted RecB family nuclease
MHRLTDGTFRFSPHDLVAYLEGDFAAWCERMQAERRRASEAGPDALEWVTPDEGDEEAALARRKGQEHELSYLSSVRQCEPTLVEILRDDATDESLTRAAMSAGAPIIYQAHLAAGDWHGYPDFLYRCLGNGCPCGGRHYSPWDTKLARSAKPHFLVQLCAYADMLEAVRGYRPGEIVFVLGQGEKRPYRTREFFYYYRQLRRSFSQFQSHWSVSRVPDPGLDRGWGRWEAAAERRLAASDHLSRVAGITRGQVRHLEENGVPTLTALAGSNGKARPRRFSGPVYDRLCAQARLQLASRGRPVPLWEHRPRDPDDLRRGLALLPPKCGGDIFFDMEGFPYAERGLEYLFGAVTVDDVAPAFHDWWAHDEAEERVAFERFIDWVMERRRVYPELHVYHYAAYEESAVKRLMGKYATRETEVDELLRQGVLVDLYPVLKQAFVIGAPSYSLKHVEHLYLPPRSGPVLSAGGSVVEYQRWIDSGQPRDPAGSTLLQGIREYNRVDCESLWGLRSWLLERQRESGIAYMPDPLRDEAPPEPDADRLAAEALAERLVERGKARLETEPEAGRLDQLVGWLVEFHRREEKPMWWRKYERHEMSVEQRYDDGDCLAGLVRTEKPAWTIKRSLGLEYRYDPAQETKLHAGDKCLVAGTKVRAEIVAMDEDVGLIVLKAGKALPDRLCLIPDEFISAEPIKQAITRYAAAHERGEVISQAVDDLLRRTPRLSRMSDDTTDAAIDLVRRLQGTTLCIQGPPGTGKTFTAAAIIADLLTRGCRIGITAHSHKVILNLMDAVVQALSREGISAPLYKVVGQDEDPLPDESPIQAVKSKDAASRIGDGAVLLGGTAWVFSRDDMVNRLDYLVVDEAGQVCLANAVAVGQSARNLILVGDQMQLAQPSQGTHPGDTGLSGLEYMLQGRATVPPELGIFLGRSRRMHPDVCRFISDAIYDGRLQSIPETGRHRVLRSAATELVPAETGVVWVPVTHDGCTQSSDEECDAIVDIVAELLGRNVVDSTGRERRMEPKDILIVAPFNSQVRCLRGRVDPRIRVGSVDKFQGQEASVVIVSLCASTLDEAPRGAEFLLSPNRLNVAVSRAQALAIVVGSPQLVDVRCKSAEEMRLVNLLCHLVQYAEGVR